MLKIYIQSYLPRNGEEFQFENRENATFSEAVRHFVKFDSIIALWGTIPPSSGTASAPALFQSTVDQILQVV